MSSSISLKGINIFNAIGFQIGWFICILKGNFLGLAFAIIFTITQLFLLYLYSDKFLLKKEIFWLMVIIIIGFCIETLFFSSGILYEYIHPAVPMHFVAPPLWIIYLWLLFATALRTSLSFLFNKHWIVYLVTAIAAPSSYFAGDHLNTTVNINEPIAISLVIIGLVWIFTLWIIKNLKHYYFEDIFHGY